MLLAISLPNVSTTRRSNSEIIIDSQECSFLQDLFIVLQFDRAVNGPFIPWREWSSSIRQTSSALNWPRPNPLAPPRRYTISAASGRFPNLREFSRSGLPYLRALTRSLAPIPKRNPTGPYTGPFTPPFTHPPPKSARGSVTRYTSYPPLCPPPRHELFTNQLKPIKYNPTCFTRSRGFPFLSILGVCVCISLFETSLKRRRWGEKWKYRLLTGRMQLSGS